MQFRKRSSSTYVYSRQKWLENGQGMRNHVYSMARHTAWRGSDVFLQTHTSCCAVWAPCQQDYVLQENKRKPQSQEPVSRQIIASILVQHDHPVILIALTSWIFQYTAQSILWIRNVPATNFGDDAACHDTMPLISVSDTRQKITVCPKKFYQIFWNNKIIFSCGTLLLYNTRSRVDQKNLQDPLFETPNSLNLKFWWYITKVGFAFALTWFEASTRSLCMVSAV